MIAKIARVLGVLAFSAGAMAGIGLAAEMSLPESPPLPKPSPNASAGVEETKLSIENPPIPQPRPEPSKGGPSKGEPSKSEPAASELEPEEQLRLVDPAAVARATTDAEDAACRSRLKDLGAEFSETELLSDPAGCFVAHPIALKSLGKGIALRPDAVLNCTMAETAVKFVQGTIAPQAKSAFGSELTGVNHASAYICRPRNGTGKLSEHAFGNALDIAAFELADKRRIEVAKTEDDRGANFLAAIRSAACGPFKTVLGPGNSDHDTHFHFDLQPRRSGSTYCR